MDKDSLRQAIETLKEIQEDPEIVIRRVPKTIAAHGEDELALARRILFPEGDTV